MKIHALPLLLLSTLLTLLPSVRASQVFAAPLVVAVDLSRDMASPCPEGEVTALELARRRILRMLSAERARLEEGSIRVLTFTDKATPLPRDPEKLTAAVQAMRAGDGQASLAAGIEGALALLPERPGMTGERAIVVFTAGGRDPGRRVLAAMDQATSRGIALRINVFNLGTCEETAGPFPDNALISVSSYCCPVNDPFLAKEQAINDRVRKLVGEYFEVDPEHIRPGDDLIDTLGADHYQAFEVLAMLCDEFQIALPARIDITNVGDISDYIIETAMSPRPQTGLVASRGEADAPWEVPVFYATDRNRTGKNEPGELYGSERGKGISYGRAVVTIPRSHKKGQVEKALFGLKFMENPKKHVILVSVIPLERESFLRAIRNSGNPDDPNGLENDILIFIHGFNNTFANAVKRTAQITLDLEFKGAPVVFTWPSDGSVFNYWQDREDIIWSVGDMEKVLAEITALAGESGRRVHLITHSMGNQGTLNALYRLALHRKTETCGKPPKPLFANIVLAAPDFDADLFKEQIAPEVVGLAENWTIYASDKDKALEHSTNLTSAVRLGMPLTFVDGMRIIDASGVDVSPWCIPESHGYYATKQVVIQDLIDTLRGKDPDRRNQLKPMERGRTRYWRLNIPSLSEVAP